MEDDCGDLESIIRFDGSSPDIADGATGTALWSCSCGYDGLCHCFPGQRCSCFDALEDKSRSPFIFGAVEECGVGEETTSGGPEETAATENNKPIPAEGSDATEQHLGIKELPGVGRFRIESTSSQDNLCGMFAVEISTDKLLGSPLTPESFLDIFFKDPEMRAFNKRKNYQNEDNFFDDQLARVLEIWARRWGSDKIQLGVIVEKGLPYIIGADNKLVLISSEVDMANERDFVNIWIHNDNKMVLEGAAMNHFSGITLLGTNEEQEEARSKEVAKMKEPARKPAVLRGRVEKKHRQHEKWRTAARLGT